MQYLNKRIFSFKSSLSKNYLSHKRTSYFKILILLLFSSFLKIHGQVNWQNSDLGKQIYFVKNNGQLIDFQNSKILFHAELKGAKYYFTKNGFFIVQLKRKDSETTFSTNKNQSEEEYNNVVIDTNFIRYVFLNTNNNVQISFEEELPYYFSFSKKINNKRETIFTNGYKKIIYKNIYSKIDLEFLITEGEVLKYNFILNKGSNVSDIKIQIPNSKPYLINQKLLSFECEIGNFKDSLGTVVEKSTLNPINCNYKIKKDVIGFEFPFEKITKTIILDPWVITNLETSSYRVYDVDFDNENNVYAQLELGTYFTNLIKLNSQGQIIWVYQPDFDFLLGAYGDFAIDKSVNHIYLVEGFNNIDGAKVIKLDKNAQELAFFPGNSQFSEMWRISFSSCDNKAVIAGGGTSNPTYQTCFLDTSLSQMTMVQYIETENCCHDVNMLALDEFGFCYQVTNRRLPSDGLFDNQLVKLSLPDLFPINYSVSSGYNFIEASTNFFYLSSDQTQFENGYNGIATINKKVFTTNGYRAKKWDGETGTLLSSFSIDTCCSTIDSLKILWGGIAVDKCENLFIGHRNEILQYDSLLNLINVIPFSDTITDIVLKSNNELLVSGYNSVGSISIQTNSNCQYGYINIEANIVESNCNEKGSASIQISGGSPPYEITWNTVPPQFGNVAENLSPGVYTVTVNDSKCKGYKLTDTILITGTIDLKKILLESHPVNVFTPNNDGVNSFFIPYLEILENQNSQSIKNYKLEILNRWGNKVFETDNPNSGWNGKTLEEKDSRDGVYFWKLVILTACDEKSLEYHGFLHLIR